MAAVPNSKRRSTRARNNEVARDGRPKRAWPLVVFDESHRLRNPYAQQTVMCRRGQSYTFAEDTVEEEIAAVAVRRMAAMDGVAGDDTSMLDEISRLMERPERAAA